MTDLTDIISKDFLVFLQNSLTRLLEGKMSVVFEDIQGRPISEYPEKRVFARKNVCKSMIDCKDNPYGREKCWESDKVGGRMAKDQGKGVLYRCHKGVGFPNFLFPIKIWAEEVVGYLYAGQFVFREMTKDETNALLKQLQEKYYIPRKEDFYGYTGVRDWRPSDFVEELTPYKVDKFYEVVIPFELRYKPEFSVTRFQELIKKQKDEFGMDPDRFIFVIESLEQLANYLSRIGNALYTLKSLIELDRKLPRSLKFKRAKALEDLRSFIYSVVVKEPESKSIEITAVEDIAMKSLSLLSDLKTYEDKYVRELIRPFEQHSLPVSHNLRPLILEFYLRNTAFEVERYARPRSEFETIGKSLASLLKEGDKEVWIFADTICEIGREYPKLRQFCVKTLSQIHQNMRWVFSLESLVQYVARMCRSIAETEKFLSRIGLFEIRPDQFVKNLRKTHTSTLARPFETLVEGLCEVNSRLHKVMSDIEKKYRALQDIGLLSAYIRDLEPIKETILETILVDPQIKWARAQREQLDLKGYRVFLNSGGLTPTNLAVSRAQGDWIIKRNEEGPVGIELEKSLVSNVETARKRIASLIKAESPDCIFFNYNTTLAIDFALRSANLRKGDRIVTTDLEHDTVRCITEYWDEVHAVRCTRVPISTRPNNPEEWPSMIADHITRNTKLVIFSHVTFGTSVIFPIVDTIRECRKKHKNGRLLILIDGAQAVGNIDVNVKNIDCDFYAFDGHKWLMGPEGSGALYVKKRHLKRNNNAKLRFPLFVTHMASGRVTKILNKSQYELGTIDSAKIIGFGEAVRILQDTGFNKIRKRKRLLTSKFIEKIREKPLFRIVNSHDALETGMVNLQISQWEQSVELYKLLTKLLQDYNIVARYIKNPPSLRFCFHSYISEMEVDIALRTLESLVEGANVNRVSEERVIDELEKLVKKSFSTKRKTRNIGVILFGPPATGKSVVIEKLSERLEKDKTVRSLISISPHKIGTTTKFRRILSQSINQQPSVVFLDEAERFFTRGKSAVQVFNTAFDEVRNKGDKVFFVAAVNKIEQIDESIRKRRLQPIYFPLPDLKTRLSFIKEKFSGKSCSGHLTLREMAELTDGFSFQDLITLCEKIHKLAGSIPISIHHFKTAWKGFKTLTTPEEISTYEVWAEKLNATTFTGFQELKRYREKAS